MKKTVVIGDTHGKNYWLKIIEIEKPDRVVLIGDYFDSWDITPAEQMYNFKEIIRFKVENPDIEVILLFGNHDYQYLPGPDFGKYSSFQMNHSFEIRKLLLDNIHHLQLAYLLNDEYLITHAGVTNTYIDNIKSELHINSEDKIPDIEQFLNDILKFKPNLLKFNGLDDTGDDITQSPIWVRPNSLFKDRYKTDKHDYYQIVGHTRITKINHPGSGNKIYFIDALDTSKEYLVINESQRNDVIIKTLKKS